MRIFLAVAGLLLVAVVLEVIARVRMHVRYGRSTADAYVVAFDPSTGLELPTAGQTFGRMHFNALGFRGSEMPKEKPAGTLRLGFLGGSTTLCLEAGPDEATWPHRLAELLARNHPEIAVEYANAALQGFTSKESLRNLKRLAPVTPDVIVIYQATNDLTRDTRALAIERGLAAGWGEERSALARISVAWDLAEKNLRLKRRQRHAAAGARLLDFDAEELAEGFRAHAVELAAASREVAPLVVLVTFCTRLRAEQTPDERLAAAATSILYMPYMDPPRLLAAFHAYNDATRAAAHETGVLLVEAEYAIPGDAVHFVDSVHLSALGCERLADTVCAQLEATEAFQALVAARAGL